MSKQPVKEIIQKVLKNDANKALDTAAYTQFAATPLVAASANNTAVTFTTNGSPGATVSIALETAHIKFIVDEMKERNIPAYDGTNYFSIGRPSTYRGVKNELESKQQYTDTGYQMIMNGEIGRYEGVRFIEQTNIASKGWTNTDEAFFFGEDTVAEAIVVPEEIRGKIPGDYGRSKGVAWYYLGGYGLVHSAATQARIVRWASAS